MAVSSEESSEIILPADVFCAHLLSDRYAFVSASPCNKCISRSAFSCAFMVILFLGIQAVIGELFQVGTNDGLPGMYERKYSTTFTAYMNLSSPSEEEWQDLDMVWPMSSTVAWPWNAEPIFRDYNRAQQEPEDQYADDKVVRSVTGKVGSWPTYVTSMDGTRNFKHIIDRIHGVRQCLIEGVLEECAVSNFIVPVECSNAVERSYLFFLAELSFVCLLMWASVKKSATLVVLAMLKREGKLESHLSWCCEPIRSSIFWVFAFLWYIVLPGEVIMATIFLCASAPTALDLVKDGFALVVLLEVQVMAQMMFRDGAPDLSFRIDESAHQYVAFFQTSTGGVYLFLVLSFGLVPFWSLPFTLNDFSNMYGAHGLSMFGFLCGYPIQMFFMTMRLWNAKRMRDAADKSEVGGKSVGDDSGLAQP